MASCGRTHVIKAALLAGILCILLNLYNFRFDKFTSPTPLTITNSIQGPKRTRTSSEISNLTQLMVLKKGNLTYNNNNIEFNNNNTTTLPNNVINTQWNGSNNNNNNSSSINSNDNKLIINNLTNIMKLVVHKNESNYNENYKYQKNINNIEIITNIDINNNNVVQKNNSIIDNNNNNNNNNNNQVKPHFLQQIMTKLGINSCPLTPPNLDGPVEVNTTFEKLENLELRYKNILLPGGWYKPIECNAKDRVAIIVPYRDRATHLPIFLQNIHPFLMKQQVEYGIFLIEQIAEGLFNRAALMNVGFVEALKLKQWDCFIFHDVDLLPMNDRNLYVCPDQPRHMSVAVDTMEFKLPYSSIFGGVSAMTTQQFKIVNGFSNSFWGWGGEDDDMSNRLKHVGFHIARYPINIARYTMLSHKKEKANPKRYEKLVNGAKKYNVDGLNSLKYNLHNLEKKVLYTWILVELKQESGS